MRQHGVPVEVTVTGCLADIGGSGSDLVGYECRGTYRVGGRLYDEAIPGNTLHRPGATVRGITVPGDPSLISTVAAVKSEQPSWRVFILPVILLSILVLLTGAIVLRWRHTRAVR